MNDAWIVSTARTAIGTADKGTLVDVDPFDLGTTVVGEAVRRAGLDTAPDRRRRAQRVAPRRRRHRPARRHRAGLDARRRAGPQPALRRRARRGDHRGGDRCGRAWTGSWSPAASSRRRPRPRLPAACPRHRRVGRLGAAQPPRDARRPVRGHVDHRRVERRRPGRASAARRWTPGRSARTSGRSPPSTPAASSTRSCPIEVTRRDGTTVTFAVDEHPRRDTTLEKLASLKVIHPEIEGFSITAGNSSGRNDGARRARRRRPRRGRGRRPRAARRRPGVGVGRGAAGRDRAGADEGDPQGARAGRARRRRRRPVGDQRGVRGDVRRARCGCWASTTTIVNVVGSGCSLGHPVAMTGARMIISLTHELRRRGGGDRGGGHVRGRRHGDGRGARRPRTGPCRVTPPHPSRPSPLRHFLRGSGRRERPDPWAKSGRVPATLGSARDHRRPVRPRRRRGRRDRRVVGPRRRRRPHAGRRRCDGGPRRPPARPARRAGDRDRWRGGGAADLLDDAALDAVVPEVVDRLGARPRCSSTRPAPSSAAHRAEDETPDGDPPHARAQPRGPAPAVAGGVPAPRRRRRRSDRAHLVDQRARRASPASRRRRTRRARRACRASHASSPCSGPGTGSA